LLHKKNPKAILKKLGFTVNNTKIECAKENEESLKLGYKNYYSVLLDYLEDDNLEHNIIGLYGEWGTGKTKLMNCLRCKIDEHNRSQSDLKYEKFDYIWYQPWKFHNETDLLSPLLYLLYEKIENKYHEKGVEITHKLGNIIQEILKYGLKKTAGFESGNKLTFLENKKDSLASVNKIQENVKEAVEFLLYGTIGQGGSSLFSRDSILNWRFILKNLKENQTVPMQRIWSFLNQDCKEKIENWTPGSQIDDSMKQLMINGFNKVLDKVEFYDSGAFKELDIGKKGKKFLEEGPNNLNQSELRQFNRLIFESVYPHQIMKSQKGLIIFIDDLERCEAEKVMKFIESLHILFDLNDICKVIVAVDREKLLEAIRTRYKDGDSKCRESAELYLEKVIKIPFELRPVDSSQFRDLVELWYGNNKLLEKWKKVFDDVKFADKDANNEDKNVQDKKEITCKERIVELFSHIGNPRQLERVLVEFHHRLKLYEKMLPDEKLEERHIIDYCLIAKISTIYICYPKIHNALENNSDLYYLAKCLTCLELLAHIEDLRDIFLNFGDKGDSINLISNAIKSLNIKNCSSSLFTMDSIVDWEFLLTSLKSNRTTSVERIWCFLNQQCKEQIESWIPDSQIDETLKKLLSKGLNEVLDRVDFFDSGAFKELKMTEEGKKLLEEGLEILHKSDLQKFNRLILESVYPHQIAKIQNCFNDRVIKTIKTIEFDDRLIGILSTKPLFIDYKYK
jgi:hypothetical protein